MQRVKKRILIVDDNPSIHEDFKKVFKLESIGKNEANSLESLEAQLFGKSESKREENPVDIVSAFQGEEALATVKQSLHENHPFHLAFVDMRMPPGWDGIKTITEIAKVDHNIHFVICTAYSDRSLDDFLALKEIQDRLLLIKKPFDHLEIILTSNALAEKWELSRLARLKMEDLEKTIQERTALIESTNRLTALGEMSAGIAHEINNPLTIIQANTSILKNLIKNNKFDEERFTKAIIQIQNTIQRIAKIITGLKTFSRDGTNDTWEDADLSVIISDALELCQKKLENADIKIEIAIPENLSPLQVNKVQISQVLLNIVLNAKDALEECKENKWIKIEAKETEKEIIISISDSGPGIPPALRDKIMNPFFTTKALGKGTGLGLSISHGIISAHQGTLKLDTKTPHTKFDITLPKTRTQL